jgi:sialate O-acetylesterase
VKVTGSWGATATTAGGADGRWRANLETPPAGGPFTVTVAGENTIEYTDVLSGDVWLCSGQSNMAMTVRSSANADEEIAAANYPRIRLMKVANVTANAPQEDCRISAWAPCTPDTARNFSAAGYYFGRKLHRELDVPVGLINSSWGGTGIEAWTPWDAQKDDPAIQQMRESWDKRDDAYDPVAAKAKYDEQKKAWDEWNKGDKTGKQPPRPRPPKQPRTDQNYPSNLYNAMIHPLVPFAMRGVIWYQGEHNSGRGEQYRVLLERKIRAWRDLWGYEFPYYFVQLPNFRAPWTKPVEGGWAVIRESFMNTAKEVPNTGMAITLDIGEADDIHPRNKQDVGDRLARLALHNTYGKAGFAWCGPIFESCEFRDGKAVVTFDTGGAPLAVRDGGRLYGFALTGVDGVAVHADATIQAPDKVVVSSPEVPDPAMVHYAWANNPVGANLINAGGLPASSFRFGEIPPFDVFGRLLPEEASRYSVVYGFDPLNGKLVDGGTRFVYGQDRSPEVKGSFRKVAYFLALQDRDGNVTYAFVSMDPFTDDIARIGVPAKASGARFQQKVTGALVKSNVPGLVTGEFPEGCNIEFWDCNYGGGNAAEIPGAGDIHDFGDSMNPQKSPGYGCMQIHNWKEKQSVICFNKFNSGNSADLGIGNSEGKTRDWTFTSSAKNIARAQFLVLVLQ